MSDQHLQDLRSARQALVDSRRSWTKIIAAPVRILPEAIRAITEIQGALDAIDRAIADEKELKSWGV